MTWWDDEAAAKQQRIIDTDRQFAGIGQWEDDDIRRSIIHLRQDIVLLVSLQSSLNKQLQTTNRKIASLTWLVGVLVLVVFLGFFEIMF